MANDIIFKIKTQRSSGNVPLTVFWDGHGTVGFPIHSFSTFERIKKYDENADVGNVGKPYLLRGFSNSIEDVKSMIGKIIETSTGNEFVSMIAKGFEEISPQRKYHGISTQIIGQINQPAFYLLIN